MKKLTLKDFIDKSKKVHGGLYDYSKVEYINNRTKVCIIDPTYGEFWQTPDSHLMGRGNRKRGNENNPQHKPSSKEAFVEKARVVHGNLYVYDSVVYINASTKVCIIDPDFGEFWQEPHSHLKGKGCAARAKREKLTNKEFARRGGLVHDKLYDYSKVEYAGMHINVCIIDPIYGEFWQMPASHLNGSGHPQRARDSQAKRRSLSTEGFIERARKKHGDLYDYSKAIYINNSTKVCIIDPLYGEFWQTPNSHIDGRNHPKRGLEIGSKKYCKKWSQAKNSPNDEQLLYFVKIKRESGDLFKIGITNNNKTLRSRLRKIKNDFKAYMVEVINIFKGSISEMFALESKIKYCKAFESSRYKSSMLKEMGKTECFTRDISKTNEFSTYLHGYLPAKISDFDLTKISYVSSSKE